MAPSKKSTPLSKLNLQWEWEGDKGVWQQYATDIQQEISKAYKTGDKEVMINQTEEVSMTIKFADMVQVNQKTKFMRRIRSCIELKDQNGFFVYEYENDNKKWMVYNTEIMVQIANALEKNQTVISTKYRNQSYEIDLDQLVEKNVESEKVRNVRSVQSTAKLPLTVSTISNKRAVSDDETLEAKKKKRPVSKSTAPIEKSTMRTITTVVGKVPVDAECTSMLDKAHVYCQDDDVFDCMLNQTNVGNNNNKFYLIQLLEENSCKKYYVWLRWGRVGYTGQNNLEHFGCDLDEAKRFFCQKFSDKTKNDFYYRDTFTKYPGKYDYVQLDYNPSTSKNEDKKKQLASIEQLKSLPVPECKLDQRLQNLIQLICNVRAMEEALLEMKFDARKNPLGKLSATQIKAGYSALKEIETYIKVNKFNSAFIEANNSYYTRIPHEFGRSTPPLIKTVQQLKQEIELLEALDDIEIAFTTLNTDTNTRLNPIDQHYEQLKCKLVPMEKTSDMYELISKYLQSTHAVTHQQYKMQIEDIFEVDRDNEKEVFKDVGNRMLLWHGSRLTNFASIISQGLRIAPPEAPVTGYMFGKGLYFADMSSKSANYCYPTPSKNVGLVLLSEVALGKCNELLQADNNAHRLPEGFSSVKGLGSTAPNMKNAVTLDDGLVIPMGPGETTDVVNPKGYTLNYNEYIVYDTKQARLRYLIKLKFLFK
ncbi:unnamed protein product [Adineta ricciae]|uniref:Poly [ADP-ribose] polymerase n=1 Tax=Adineta ricciae TaxID=249248 RepID=A0A814WLQ1_ADIRI|nr:unnamed protein product [Adineta ricciae]CAF1203945.1 unnamed protein product [Adineta ricciae]